MKTILVPTDFSDYGLTATRTAASLAEKTHAKILLQHNIPTLLEWSHMTGPEHREHPDVLEKSIVGENHLNQIMGDSSLRHLNVSKVVTQGITHEKIVEEARTEHADVIIIGSHGNDKHDRFFIGSNIQKVMRDAPCPVMTIGRDVPYPKWDKVVVPFSFDEDISKSFEKIKSFVIDLGSTIYLLYVNTPHHFKDEKVVLGQMQSLIHRHPELHFKTAIYNHREVETGILEYCHDIGADWIAMATHDRKRKEKYLIGVTEAIAFKADIPLLTVLLN